VGLILVLCRIFPAPDAIWASILVQLPVFEHCSFCAGERSSLVIRGGCGGLSFSVMLQICGHLAACVAKNIQPMKKACAAMAGAGF
jgi:hypothetical protein